MPDAGAVARPAVVVEGDDGSCGDGVAAGGGAGAEVEDGVGVVGFEVYPERRGGARSKGVVLRIGAVADFGFAGVAPSPGERRSRHGEGGRRAVGGEVEVEGEPAAGLSGRGDRRGGDCERVSDVGRAEGIDDAGGAAEFAGVGRFGVVDYGGSWDAAGRQDGGVGGGVAHPLADGEEGGYRAVRRQVQRERSRREDGERVVFADASGVVAVGAVGAAGEAEIDSAAQGSARAQVADVVLMLVV